MFRLLHLPQRAPRATLALIALATLFFGYFARSLRFDSSVENLLPSDDPERIYYEAVRREFGSEEATVIGIFADDVLSVATATKIAALSAELAGPPLRQLARGDVIGEMGLLRDRPRSADVMVVEDAEYLVIDGPSLHRIRRRHPRIPSVLLFNLSLMLSDRLENTTEQLVRFESTAAAALPDTVPQTVAPPGPDPLPAARGAE